MCVYAMYLSVELWRTEEGPGGGDTDCCEEPNICAGTKLASQET